MNDMNYHEMPSNIVIFKKRRNYSWSPSLIEHF